ncbi:hypothetical protein KHQ88_01680 [Mycoplasmatota bacterium]|nr:hypothetical protein KHQ88_01680 [Mycoplasmatota bacterium]
MIKMKNIISFVILIAFYLFLGYLFLDSPLAILSVGIGGILFLFLSSSAPILLLVSDEIREDNYSKDNVMLSVNITHILLVISLISFVSIYDNFFGDISPVLGYIIMSVSLLINILCLLKDMKKSWVWIALSLHILMFIIFMFWQFVGLILILLALIYMIVHNVFVVSYGILRYGKLLSTRRI